MLTNIAIPSSFSLIRRENLLLLLKKDYKDLLLRQGIEDLGSFLKKHRKNTDYFSGRTRHPSIPIDHGKKMIIRQYSHGGILRALTRNVYFFGSRSFRELALTEEIRSCGIPTIQPIGAIHRFIFFRFYKAYFLSLEIPHAVDLLRFFQKIGPHPSPQDLISKRKMIRSAGLVLRQFHQSGIFHGDLQLRNILVSGDHPLLIDFDRSYRRPRLSAEERAKNLFRLARSAKKWKRLGLPITRTDFCRFFSAYAQGDSEIKELMRKKLRTYTTRTFFYRLGWAFERMLGGNKLEAV